MAKLAREGRLREQRAVKKAKKDARKLGPPDHTGDSIASFDIEPDEGEAAVGEDVVAAAAATLGDAGTEA